VTARHITIFSSRERCGIQTYAATLADALRSLGHRVELVGIGWWDSGQLLREAGRVRSDVVIVEHEFALYRNLALAVAMARLRLAGKRVLLSMHELEPDKFWNYHKVVAALHFRMRGSVLGDLVRLLWATAEAAQRMLRYRLSLWMIGAFADRIVFHSPRATTNAGLVTGDPRKVVEIPHFVEPLPGVSDPSVVPADAAVRKGALRERLGLPHERFVFVAPGFIVRRKRLLEVIRATPADALLVIAGTESQHDEGYLAEIRRYVDEHRVTNVVIDTDYDRMPAHVMAADAVVLFYRDAFQSGIASNAVWAEKPMIVPADPAFDMYGGAALRASTEEELHSAMQEIQRPDVTERLRSEARRLKRELSPEAMAQRYVEAIP
jgi:glycosyltransferase involved in cell wall biosynthesis